MTSPLMAEKRLTGPPTGSAGPGPHRTNGDTFSFLMESERTVLLNDRAIVNSSEKYKFISRMGDLQASVGANVTQNLYNQLPQRIAVLRQKRGYPTRY